ncbi:MAG: GNAT family protein [Bacteroidia bacterium]|nr:GNAT family protein [Bacteroidia bacterium]
MKLHLFSEKIRLRALEPEDLELIYAWENNEEVWNISNTLVPFSKYILALYIKNSDQDIYATKQLRLMIDTVEGKTVGAIDLFEFDPHHSRIGIGILIHSEADRLKGYASSAIELLIIYCFDKLNIHQIYANIEPDNLSSISLFEKHGFILSGTKKEWLRDGQGWKDELFYQRIKEK